MVRPEQGERISKIDTYLNCAEVFAYRSTCIKRKYGSAKGKITMWRYCQKTWNGCSQQNNISTIQIRFQPPAGMQAADFWFPVTLM